MDVLSDHALMLQVRDGQVDKLGLLYERHSRPLFGFFYRMCSQAAVSEDLVQNVFYRILRYRHTYKSEGKFSTWMYHLARNVYADQYRKKNPLYHAKDLDEAPEPVADVGEPMGDEDKKRELQILKLALDALPENKKSLIVMARYQKIKYKQIADILGTSEGAVKVRIHRALTELRTVYHQLEKERI